MIHGPHHRARREAAALSLQQASVESGIDMTKLSRFERGMANLSAEQQRRFESVIDNAIRARRSAIDAVLAQDHAGTSA